MEESLKEFNSFYLKIPRKFSSVEKGYRYVKENGGEGLILKTNKGLSFKMKIFKETKSRILSYDTKNGKGSFEIEFENRIASVSKTSMTYINTYTYLKKTLKRIYMQKSNTCMLGRKESPFNQDYVGLELWKI